MISSLAFPVLQNFFDSVNTFLTSFFESIVNVVKYVIFLLRFVVSLLTIPPSLTPFIWAPIGVSMIIVVGVAALKVYIGRDNQ